MAEHQNAGDQDAKKGAVEGSGRGPTEREQAGNTSMTGQNPHRTNSRLVKDNDSDFPEPGGSPEHSGQQQFTKDQHGRPNQESGVAQRGSTGGSGERVDQDPGQRQKEKQSDKKDDPLAA